MFRILEKKCYYHLIEIFIVRQCMLIVTFPLPPGRYRYPNDIAVNNNGCLIDISLSNVCFNRKYKKTTLSVS